MSTIINGFSKLSKDEKIDWIVAHDLNDDQIAKSCLKQYWNDDAELQKLHDEFSENTLSNFYIPWGVAPNFLINDRYCTLPMAIEESSVVAAAANAAKFWVDRGGFKTTVKSVEKLGHVHFLFAGNPEKLHHIFDRSVKAQLLNDSDHITQNMRNRGGGILSLTLVNKTLEMPHYYQIQASFDTQDSMGANFINSCLEQFAKSLQTAIQQTIDFSDEDKASLQIVMCILSNYTPNCLVHASVSCTIDALSSTQMDGKSFAHKFQQAVHIAKIDPYRAVTHNKGIMNGVDALVIATGNDFRAIEACAHAYASREGRYQGLTDCEISANTFYFSIDLPISLGTVGGLTALHPLVKIALRMLGNPRAEELMGIAAVAGLAQNFSALRSLTTSGIQKGHMKMHLLNILNQLGATESEKQYFIHFFRDKTVSHHTVVEEFHHLRNA